MNCGKGSELEGFLGMEIKLNANGEKYPYKVDALV